jgi:type I restriction enzyme S subunit
MNLQRIDRLFKFERGSLQSLKCEAGQYPFITASSDWKTHKEFSHDCEALIFAAAAAGSLGRTHYVNGKFITSDLCFLLTPKDKENFPVDLQFYHLIFGALRGDIVAGAKAPGSNRVISLRTFGSYEVPYFPIEAQLKIKQSFVKAEQTRDSLSVELSNQLKLVSQLRQSFLREAMQGQLVPQEVKDEPAGVLLERIKVEKEKLIAAKKIKAEKPLSAIKAEEIPFEIPSNWTWCRFEDVIFNQRQDVRTGPCGASLQKSEHRSSGIPVWGIESISKAGKFTTQNKIFVTEEKADDLKSFLVEAGDLIISRSGTVAELCMLPVGVPKGLISTNLIKISVDRQVIYPEYFCYLIKGSPCVRNMLADFCSGSTRLFLTQSILKKLIFPLSPLAEQKQIVKKLEKLLAFCDDLEVNIKESKTQAETLLQVALKEALEPKNLKVSNEEI